MAEHSLAAQLVDAMNDMFGSHPGSRAAHAKGTLCEATFTPTKAAAKLSRAPHFNGGPVRATVRFSNGSGNPNAHDGERDSHGLATKLYLDDGATTDIVAVSTPTFPCRTPEEFLGLLRAARRDPETGQPDLEKLGPFFEAHPHVAQHVMERLAVPPAASYAQITYYGIHAFRFVDAGGDGRWGRYRWVPEAGEASLEDDDAKARDRDFLQGEIAERMAHGPVRFTLVLQLAEDGDPLDDPNHAWPEERERVDVGRLEVTGLDTTRERGDDVLVFDPQRVVDGIALSDDPVLRVRRPAYAVSVGRRTGVWLDEVQAEAPA